MLIAGKVTLLLKEDVVLPPKFKEDSTAGRLSDMSCHPPFAGGAQEITLAWL